MSETIQVYVGICAFIPSLIYALCYAIGGRSDAPVFHGHYWRRLVAPIVYTILVLGLSLLSNKFKAEYIIFAISFTAAHWLGGYGGRTIWEKLVRRTWTASLSALAVLPIALFAHSYPVWELFWMQWGLALSAHLLLGILNPLKAPYEESLIAFLTVCIVPFMVL